MDDETQFSIFPCLTWVKQGASKKNPHKVRLDAQELQKVIKETELKLGTLDVHSDSCDEIDEVKTNRKRKKKKVTESQEDDDIIKKYGLDDYDDDEEDDNGNEAGGRDMPHSLGSMSYYSPGEKDPYITANDEVESDEEEMEIQDTDNLLLVGMADNDASLLYVYVYNTRDANLYIHHEIILPSYPLCLEWLDYDSTDSSITGNYVAVGSMESTIDVWDLDVVDSLEAAYTLGTRHPGRKKKKKMAGHGHTDAVLDLSWNTLSRHHLASASADFIVGVWDMSQARMVRSLRSHTEKVQCVRWSPVESHTLASGSFDHSVKLYDGRTEEGTVKSWTLDGEIEQIRWDHFTPSCLYASTEQGTLTHIDTRHKKPLYSHRAHNSALVGLGLSSGVKGMVVTVSSSGEFKTWDTSSGQPDMVAEKDLNTGEIHCMGCNPDLPFIYAVGGANKPVIRDARKDAGVVERFMGATGVTVGGSGQCDVGDGERVKKKSGKKKRLKPGK